MFAVWFWLKGWNSLHRLNQEHYSSSGSTDDKQLKWKITLVPSCKWEPLMWFWDNAHWLIWPRGLWHWMSVLVISAKSEGASDICHQYTSAEKKKNTTNILIYFFPQRWGDMRSKLSLERRYCSLWAWLKPAYWKSDYQFIENAFL